MMRLELVNILADHADALIRGDDTTDVLVERYGALAPELAGMLQLAQQLRWALVPVMPRRSFTSQLQAQLQPPAFRPSRRLPVGQRRFWLAVAGSVVSVAGATVLLKRHYRPGDGRSAAMTTPI